MWRVFLAFGFHRLLLFIVALLTINSALPSSKSSGILPNFASFSTLREDFLKRVSEGPEIEALARLSSVSYGGIFSATHNPFLWLGHLLSHATGMSPVICLILFSNLFFLLFLRELNELLNRMITADVATITPILVVLWPTSYEMSLGSTLSLTCYLVTLAIRAALDDKWYFVGIAVGLLAGVDPIGVGLIPLLLFMFWYFQRHFQWQQVVKKAAFVLIPSVVGFVISRQMYAHLDQIISGSAMLNLTASVSHGQKLGWTLSDSFAGQTITAILFIGGAITAAASNSVILHRAIPLYLFLITLSFSPYGSIASRVLIAGEALEGIALISARPVLVTVQLMFLVLGILEVRSVFGS